MESDHQSTSIRQGTRPRQTITQRLQEVNLCDGRFIRVSKGKTCYDHDSRFDRPPNGNYGVYASEQLVLVDIDDPEDFAAHRVGLPPTFTVRTPHGGEHRYYISVLDSEIPNKRAVWGEIRSENQYVVGPGSELVSCDKDEHDCSRAGEGHYGILSDRKVAFLDDETAETVIDAAGGRDRSGGTTSNDGVGSQNASAMPSEHSTNDRGSSPGETGERSASCRTTTSAYLSADVWQRLQVAFNSKHGDEIRALFEGQYADAGFDDDRSRAEMSLVSRLGWFFENDQDTVIRLMNLACQRYPNTDTGENRKWKKRNDSYRTDTAKNGCDHNSTYTPPQPPLPYEERPEVSYVTLNLVQLALLRIGPATKREITNQPEVDRCPRQVNRALTNLKEQGGVTSWRDTSDARRRLYSIRSIETLTSHEIEDIAETSLRLSTHNPS